MYHNPNNSELPVPCKCINSKDGEMSEWLKEHAWKSTPAARADAHQIPPTHARSTTSHDNDVHARVAVNHGVDPGFRGVSDTVLTQNRFALHGRKRNVHQERSSSLGVPTGDD